MEAISATLDRTKVRVGITPTLWWNDDFVLMDAGIPFEQCVSEMALAGFEGCSIGHKFPTDPAELRAALDLRGLHISEPWVSTYFTIKSMRSQTLEAFQTTMKFIQAVYRGENPMLADMVVAELGLAVHPLPVALFANRPVFNSQQWADLISGLEELGRIANDSGTRLCYHPHMGTGVMYLDDIVRLMDNTKPELVHLLLDTGHLDFAGVDPLTVAQKYSSRINHIHLKNTREEVVQQTRAKDLSFQEAVEGEGKKLGVWTVAGDPAGSIVFPPIFEALAKAGFKGWLVVEAEQDARKTNPLHYALMARKYLKQQLGW